MCTGAVIGAIVASLASAGVEAYSQDQTLKHQDEAAAAAARRQMRYNERAHQSVQQAVQQYAPAEQRQAAQQDAQAQLNDAFSTALSDARVRGQGVIAPTSQGAVSGEYSTAKAAALADQIQQAADAARLAAATSAPSLARQQSSQGVADIADQLGLLGDFSHGQAGVDKTRIQQAGQTNPWLEAAGGALGGLSQGLLIKGAYGGDGSDAPAASANGGALQTYKLPRAAKVTNTKIGY